MTFSRREFLQQAGIATTAGVLVGRDPSRLWTARPEELFADPDEAELRALAQIAIDEARKAGATFADVRVHVANSIALGLVEYRVRRTPPRPWPGIGFQASVTIRAIVDGAWGSSSSIALTRDEVADGARVAVESARANRPRHRNTLELAPTPSVPNGVWEMPIAEDPFKVPLAEQREVAKAAVAQVVPASPKVVAIDVGIQWRKFTTIFASTDGTVLLQRRRLAMPGGTVTALEDVGKPNGSRVPIETIRHGPYGYEALGASRLADGMWEAADRASEMAKRLREGVNAEVGRFDLVVSADVVNALIMETLSPALELPRVLGYDANREGTSFAAPPAEVLGRLQVASPLVTLRGDRTRPGDAATTAWDDDGVAPDAYTFIDKGVITDYHTNRQTAATLAGWYRSKGEPVRSHGCAAQSGQQPPFVCAPNITMTPGRDAVDVEDLIADTKRGYYVESAGGRSDQQLLNTQFSTRREGVRRIINGKLGPQIDFFAFQFITHSFWKSVAAIGGPKSVETRPVVTNQDDLLDQSGVFPFSTFRTVPMRVRDVNVLNFGRTA